MPRLPPVITARHLPASELCAMRMDGEVYALADGWCTIDELEGPHHRAAALLGDRSPRLIAELGSAAWIWGATATLPRPVEFCVDLGARARLGPNPLTRVRELVLDPGDRVALGAAMVTSALRTAVDLARFRQPLVDADAAAIISLAQQGGFGFDECLELLNRRRNLPEKRRATERLSRLLVESADVAVVAKAAPARLELLDPVGRDRQHLVVATDDHHMGLGAHGREPTFLHELICRYRDAHLSSTSSWCERSLSQSW